MNKTHNRFLSMSSVIAIGLSAATFPAAAREVQGQWRPRDMLQLGIPSGVGGGNVALLGCRQRWVCVLPIATIGEQEEWTTGVCTSGGNPTSCESCSAPPPSSPCRATVPDASPGWYGFANSRNIDRERELRSRVGAFQRIEVQGGTTFDSLCSSLSLRCSRVIDWEGHAQSCFSSPYSWGDGSRLGYCE